MGIKKLKSLLTPVPEKLRSLRSHDSNDHWLVQDIGFDEEDYPEATHVMIGCPLDEGVRRNNGRAGAAEAPLGIRSQLYRLQSPKKSGINLFDAGDIGETDPLEKAHDVLTETVSQFLKDNKKVIVLGGGNDISYADVRALAEVEKNISAINVDAHLDMRIADKMTSGTPYRKLIEDGYLEAKHFYEFGIRPESNASFYLEDAENLGVHIYWLPQLIEKGVVKSFQKIVEMIDQRPFFLGLDVDSVQAADAPGVSASSPTGFSGREVIQLIRLARQKENLKLFEITEVNPQFDIDNRTVKLAAQFIYKYLFE